MSLTAANSTILLSVPFLFPIPFQLKGFAADDVEDTDPIEMVETLMGVDGNLSAGFVFVAVKQAFHLQADSPSIAYFDQLGMAMQSITDVYSINATISLPGVGLKWAMTNGYMTGYPIVGSVKKLIQPRTFTITWNQATLSSI